MKKGDLVRLNVSACFSEENGGGRHQPLINSFFDDRGEVIAYRPTTYEEKIAWYNSPEAQGFNDAGETKLSPTVSAVFLRRDMCYVVKRARCSPTWNYRKQHKKIELIDTISGEHCFVDRELLEVVSSH